MVKISATRTCIYCKQYKINKHMCWNRHCLDFAVIRLLVERPKELTCDECEKWIDPISMLCVNERCLSYSRRRLCRRRRNRKHFTHRYATTTIEDSEEEEALMKRTKKRRSERKCKQFISENDPIIFNVKKHLPRRAGEQSSFVRTHTPVEGRRMRMGDVLKCTYVTIVFLFQVFSMASVA